MCYHYSINATAEEIEERFNAAFESIDLYEPVYHTSGFVFSRLPVILNKDPYHVRMIHWGLVPSWSKDRMKAMAARGNTLNARCETLYEKPSFRGVIKSKRCLVPATGFFEWMDRNKIKYPFHISLTDQKIFAFGGIWDSCNFVNENGEKECLESFSIITTDANPLMEKIHNLKKRMPLILPQGFEKDWLNDELSKEDVEAMLLPYPDEKMKAYTISKLITSKSENSNVNAVLEARSYPELNEQGQLF